MLSGCRGGETGHQLRPDGVKPKPGAKGDCYPPPAAEAEGADILGSCCHTAANIEILLRVLPMCSLRIPLPREHAAVVSLAARWTVGQRLPEL